MKFQFKQFTIEQDRCAMKIGTDSVLLGAWVSLEHNPKSILDIGAGMGIISLQLAQRSAAESIDAIEINSDAFEQCVENFEASPWGDRLFCYHCSAKEFGDSFSNASKDLDEPEEKYDLIISNPPFYTDQYISDDDSRNTARFTKALSFQELISIAALLLSDNGMFALIIPKKEESNIIDLASKKGLFPKRICRVRGTITSNVKRSLLEFSSKKIKPVIDELTLEITRHQYTSEYIALVDEFYLNM